MTEATKAGRRPNKRGHATREAMLDAALRSLAEGGPNAASANRIAKDIGVTWGAVKYQFGDIDGLWAAVLRRTAERRSDLPALADPTAPLHERVATIIDILYDGLTAPDSRAIETLRMSLPRDMAELDRLYPKTAAELSSWGASWIEICQKAFADVDVDPERISEVAAFIPGAMRGITSERQLGGYYDLDKARRGLTNAIVHYLQHSRQ
ncbi:MAG: TetR family transcriptional regulator [Mycobacterium sp.]